MRSQRPRAAKPAQHDWTNDPWLNPLPQPEVEEGGASMMDMWHEAARELDAAFAPTQPSGQAPLSVDTTVPQQPPPTPASGALTADALMLVARRNNRVCPRPHQWTRLYEILQGRRHHDLAPPPLERQLWSKLSSLQKRVCLREQIEWAERRGKLPQVARFIEGLEEGDWVHMGEA